MKSQLIYSLNLPKLSHFPDETVLFYDSILSKNKKFQSWMKKFPFAIALKSGENLKTIKSLESVLKKISDLPVSKTTQLTFVAVGGGSVGDFVGFLASVFLRGRRLVNIPSTWLAAVDSAHGGKNGLNFLKTKNQLGTYYPADEIFICQQLLISQPEIRLQESLGEMIKIAILKDEGLFAVLENKPTAPSVYKWLPMMIQHKYDIVELDPTEKNGIRRLLNLGHTLGHVLESALGLPHGVAVSLGIQFSARWSFSKSYLSETDFIKISMLIDSLELKHNLNNSLKKIKKDKITSLLSKDKKLTNKSQMDFIFIKKIGECLRESVSLEQIIKEIERQKQEF